jgi:hypothetical protein
MTRSAKQPLHPPEDEEERLDQAIRSQLGEGPESYSPEQWRGLRAHARLPLLYAGRFVAFHDTYEGEGTARRLVHRQVLCASRTLEGLHKRMAALPAEQQQAAQIIYVEKSHLR